MKKIVSLILVIIFITACGSNKKEFYLTYHDEDIKLDNVFKDLKYGYNDFK